MLNCLSNLPVILHYIDLYLKSSTNMVNDLKFEHFSHLFANIMMVFKAGIHKIFFRVANREDPDQDAS